MNGPDCQYAFKMFLYLNMPTLNHYLISKRKHVNALNNCLINKSTKKADPKNENIHCDKSFVITFHEINASLTRVGPPVHTGKAKDITPPESYALASHRDNKMGHRSREPELEETTAGAVCMLMLNVYDPVHHSIAPFPLMNTRVYILETLP